VLEADGGGEGRGRSLDAGLMGHIIRFPYKLCLYAFPYIFYLYAFPYIFYLYAFPYIDDIYGKSYIAVMDNLTVSASRTPKQLGANLRRYRKRRNLTQIALSNQINKRQATISTLEGAGSGTLETLFAVLAALDLELTIRPRSKTERVELGKIF
jgi:HTH-type transcriptional regulator/antitoxin HipB